MLSVTQQGGGSDIDWTAVAVLPPAGGMASAMRLADGEAPALTPAGVVLGESLLEVASWITMSPDQGTTPGSIQVTVDTAGLSAGPNLATVLLVGWPASVENCVQWVDVTVWVPAGCFYLPLVVD